MTDPIRSSIGYAGFGDNILRGLSVRDDLFGKSGYWNALSLSIGGPPLDRGAEAHLDDLCVAMVAPDPRIWPLKVTWLVASYGSAWAGLSAAHASFADAFIGPWPTVEIAELYDHVFRETRGNAVDAVSLLAPGATRRRVPGFGVAGPRAVDERIALIRDAVARRGQSALRVEFAAAIADQLLRLHDLVPNVGLFVATALSDVGFQPLQVGLVVHAFLELQVVGNSFESASGQLSSLQALDPDAVHYEGMMLRQSSRARGEASG